MATLNTLQLIALVATATWTSASFSHIVLEHKAAPVASTYKAVFQVSHGCKGEGTTALRVQTPAGFKNAKPMPKAGWVLSIEADAITWTASSATALPDAHFDEFVLRGRTPDAPGALWFAVRQSCGAVVQDWAEVPATGTDTKGLKLPAALLQVMPAAAAAAGAKPAMPAGMDHSKH